MNSYAEYLVKRKKTIIDVMIILCALLGGFCATFALLPILFIQMYGMLAFLGIAAVWFVVYKLISSRNVEFEYCVTENVLDVDKITGKQNRKQYVTIDLKNAEIIAPAVVEYETQFSKQGLEYKYNASMFSNDALDFFVIFTNDQGKTCRLLFTPNQSVLDMIRKANPRNTFFE